MGLTPVGKDSECSREAHAQHIGKHRYDRQRSPRTGRSGKDRYCSCQQQAHAGSVEPKRIKTRPWVFSHADCSVHSSYRDRQRTCSLCYSPRQQSSPACTGGHGTEPYEQNTQQSPLLGRRVARQAEHVCVTTQAFVGISSVSTCPHEGQVRAEDVTTMERIYPLAAH